MGSTSAADLVLSPAVVAVLVTRDPGPWFDDAVASLAAQDHPELAVLVLDAGSVEDPTGRVAAVAPTAFVRRFGEHRGWTEAANEVASMVDGAEYFFFCHDDVAAAPDVVRLLVDEAERSGAGIVGPKIVAWDDHERLLAIGLGFDRTGFGVPLVDRRELDQAQHDGVREVVAVPGVAMLVRADLFRRLGGFDELLNDRGVESCGPDLGEDADFCWRARIAGAKVFVQPAARAAHAEAVHGTDVVAGARNRPGVGRARSRALERNRQRTVLKNTGAARLPLALMALTVQTIGAVIVGAARHGRQHGRDSVAGWVWNARHLVSLVKARRTVQGARGASDRAVNEGMLPASARLRSALRDEAAEDSARLWDATGRTIVAAMRRGPARWIITSLFVLVLFEVVGTRGLLGRSLPGVGQFQPFPSPSVLLRHSFSGWRTTGLGSTAFAPPAFVMLALSGYALLGSMQLLQKLLVIGMIPIGLIGVWRLARHLSDQREDDTTTADPSEASAASRIAVGVRVVAILAYAALPLPYESLAKGNWRGLIAYGAMPWLFRSLIRAAETQPLVRLARRSTAQTERQLAHFRLGLLLAMATAFVPEMPLVIGVSAASLSLGSCLIREARGRWSPLSSAAAATLLSVVLLAPWSVQMLRRPTGSGLLPGSRFAPESGSATVIDLLAFHHGSVGIRSLGIGLSVSALSPLLLASGRRLEWAIRFWLVIVVCTALAWVTGRGWLGGGITTTDVLLVPAGLSVALCVALGAAGFAIDLRGHRFGWRQSLISVSIVAVVLGGVPSIWAARGGRWGMPKRDVAAKLGWMAPEPRGPYRTLWVGRPTALPVEGWPLAKGLVYATTRNGLPTVLDSWPGPALGGTPEIARAMNLMRAQGTTRVGRLLAPMAILYVVVWGGNSASNVAESEVTDGLRTQLDLSQVGGVDDVLIYKNEAWAPGIVALSGTAQELSRSADVNAATLVDLSSSPSALAVHRSETDVDGSLSTESVIALSESYSARWHLRSAGNEPVGRRSFGWATAFDLRPSPTPMPAELRYDPPNLRGVLLIAQIGLWFVCLVVWRRLRRRLPARISPETVSLTDWTDDGEADSGDSPVDTDPFADGFEPEGRLADELWQTFARRRNTTNRQRATSQRDDEVESSR